MPKRIVLQTIILTRDVNGERKRFSPPINQVFDFTDEELKSITALNPEAVGKVLSQNASGEQLVTLTQTEIDAKTDEAVRLAIEQFKTAQAGGNPDANNPNADGAAGAGAGSAKPGKKGAGKEKDPAPAGTDNDNGSDDDI